MNLFPLFPSTTRPRRHLSNPATVLKCGGVKRRTMELRPTRTRRRRRRPRGRRRCHGSGYGSCWSGSGRRTTAGPRRRRGRGRHSGRGATGCSGCSGEGGPDRLDGCSFAHGDIYVDAAGSIFHLICSINNLNLYEICNTIQYSRFDCRRKLPPVENGKNCHTAFARPNSLFIHIRIMYHFPTAHSIRWKPNLQGS